MRAWMLMALLTAGVPAAAQLQDLVRETERLGAAEERKVTLDLRREPAAAATARLAEATGLPLECDPRLADRKVTLIANDRPAREVLEALAQLVAGQWRRAEGKRILAPADPVEVLSEEEILGALRVALQPPLERLAARSLRSPQRFEPGFFTPEQMRSLQTGRVLPASRLSPEQREEIVNRVSEMAFESLMAGGARRFRPGDGSSLTLRIERQPGGESLVLQQRGARSGMSRLSLSLARLLPR